MGNCLVIQDRKEIKIMSVVDGSEVLKMPSPGSDESLTSRLPVKAPAAVVDPGSVRVKLVISKQELKKMLDKEGMSLDDMVSLMRKEQASDREQDCCGGWRPALESIPEGRDL
ncbi:hypothetical protein SEVIR_8G034400v4 [Setaria viridis]|uniref:Uncharacterized protein n=1 Tax=Setaria viridis TaxID=4556 RepID=A0A4U6TCY2_SETVI|nr:uncharacterized protein LOC117867104 [Setaria viridis]TKV99311.1 hypothetical protein SEVIR_8G034400v2 [Setaria viridis]